MDSAVSTTTLRIVIAVIGVVILVVIYFFGRPRQPGQGHRFALGRRGGARIEPVLGTTGDASDEAGREACTSPEQGELDVAAEPGPATPDSPDSGTGSALHPESGRPLAGQRPRDFPVDRIVSLFVVAGQGELFHGSDIVVAAEKAGLRFGAMHIFHRLVDGQPDAGPVFSMANMVKPGYFEMSRIADMTTPGVTFFITLPGPLAALDAWETMLPVAQRIAALLDGELLDEAHNALGRQRVAGLREELRAWDRRHEGVEIGPPPRR